MVEVREPGGTPLGETIRSLLLDPSGDVSERAELLLFAAARAHLVDRVIRPALGAGQIVIADRYTDSTLAYQGGGRGLASHDTLYTMNTLATGGVLPVLTVLVDLPVEKAALRRGDSPPDRMEQEDLAFFERVRTSYLSIAADQPQRVLALDGTLPKTELHERVLAAVRLHL